MGKKLGLFVMILCVCGINEIQAADNDVLESVLAQLQSLNSQVDQLARDVDRLQRDRDHYQTENKELRDRLALLEHSPRGSDVSATSPGSSDSGLVDLNYEEATLLPEQPEAHVLSNPWWQNIQISGFGAAGYYETGSGGTREHGSFEVKEATLFIEGEVWDDTSFYIELQTNRLGKDDDKFTRTGEVYVHMREIALGSEVLLGLKLGRFDIPFGEEYLWQDAVDNPLITYSASYPYGWDEGLLVYSEWNGINWIAAITDGSDERSADENSDKAFNLKLYGQPSENWYTSASYMHNGSNIKSAVEFGGSHFEPVSGSSVGTSTSEEVDSDLLQVDARYSFDLSGRPGYIALAAGMGRQDDDDSLFDRDLYWYSIEPFLEFHDNWYTVLRYSEIGTYDDQEGYHFDGKPYAGGNSAYGFDSERFRRLGVGIGWRPNPRMTAKLEIGKDWYDLIEPSTLEDDDDRDFLGFEMAVEF